MVAEPDLFELPPEVRERVIALAARGLGLLPPTDVPQRLRSIARFAPRRRAELGAGPLARALADDAVLRRRLSEVLQLTPAAGSPAPGAVNARTASDALPGGGFEPVTSGSTAQVNAGVGAATTAGAATVRPVVPDPPVRADTAGMARLWLARPPGWVDAVGSFLRGGDDGDDDGDDDGAEPDTGGHAFTEVRGRHGRHGPRDPIDLTCPDDPTHPDDPNGPRNLRNPLHPDDPDDPDGRITGRHARHGRRAVPGGAADAAGARLADELATARAEMRAAKETARREVAGLRGELATAQRTARAAVGQAAEATAATHAAREQAATADREFRAAERRSRRRLEDLTADLAAARRDVRTVREVDDARLRLLLETLGGAVDGIARELALPDRPGALAPVDTVDSREPAAATDLDARASSWSDPGTLGRFLTLPRAHLIVDGYNVTKAALPTLPLARQRELLVRNLAGLAAQTGAEITIVFDGADVTAVPVVGSRGIRVRFSPLGVSADAVIRAMARAEPPGRPVVVVSSDREVADGVRRSGATAVASTVLVRRLLGG